MKILVTGGSGFLGRHLVEELKKHGKVTLFERRKDPRITGVEWCIGTITDPEAVDEAVKGKDVVYHLAALLDESAPRKDLYEVNVGGTLNVLQACKKFNVGRLVYVSTVGVEHAETQYEKTKLNAETLTREYFRRYGLPVITIRPAMIYGPSKYWFHFFAMAEKGLPIAGSGENSWHFVYIKNVIDALVKAMKNGKPGEVYTVADAKGYTYKQVYETIFELLEKRGKPHNIPVWAAHLVLAGMNFTRVLRGKKAVFTHAHITRMTRDRKHSITKAKRELGYAPRYDLKKGMEETVKQYLDLKHMGAI